MNRDAVPLRFPELQDVIGPDQSEYEREFVRAEYGSGLPYYLNRLDQLMFSGGHVLDAGCGVGQWSLALAQRFARVEAIDLKPPRLAVLKRAAGAMGVVNIGIRQGSMEQLPYPGDSFDAVFCYGVVMFTEMERTLREFFRVLRPGGRIYVCLNADGWSRYLIEERGRSDQKARQAGQTTLYNTYWWRALQKGIIPSLQKNRSLLQTAMRRIPPLSLLYRMIQLSEARLGWKRGSRRIARFLLSSGRGGEELWNAVRHNCGEEFCGMLLDDVWAILLDAPARFQWGVTRAVQPHEFESLAAVAGFVDFQWSPEAGLVCDWPGMPVEPKYPGTFDDVLAVWECVFVKPDAPHVVPPVERHYRAADTARQMRLYQGNTGATILSNGSRWTYPRYWFEHAQCLAKRLGGDVYLRKLARRLTENARSEEDAVRRLICFVQRAIFRDPVSQPLTETGAIPDALTVLLCARGRCGHTAALILALARQVGLEARLRQFPRHVVAEVKVGERWAIADADAFKNGVLPVNRHGRLITLDEIVENPFHLDRFPATGWFMRPGTTYTRDASGAQISGYVDAVTPDRRGYISGYYVAEAEGYPPSAPAIVRFESKEGRFRLEWTPAAVRADRLLGYRVSVGTASRGWSYDRAGDGDEILQLTATDILSADTLTTGVEGDLPVGVGRIFASVTAYSSRVEKEPETHFWPSEEAVCEF